MRVRLIGTLAGLLLLSTGATATAKGHRGDISASGFDTTHPPQLVPTEPGVRIDPILSVGDTLGGYQRASFASAPRI